MVAAGRETRPRPPSIRTPREPWWRTWLMKERDREVGWILKIQSYRSPLLDMYFLLSSLLGEELFYILFLPLSSWVMSSQLTVHLTVLLAMSVGIGNILKNFFLIPRPPHPPVWVHAALEKDHGLPSTHTMTAVTIPWYLLIFYGILSPHAELSPLPVALVALWTASVAMSRMYNGHHTPLDVGMGAVLGVIFLFVFTEYMRPVVDSFLLHNTSVGPLTALGTSIVMLLAHPVPPKAPTPAYAETGLVTGTMTGAFLGVWLRATYTVRSVYAAYHASLGLPAAYPHLLPLLADHFYVVAALRFVVGVLFVMVTRLVVKNVGKEVVVRVAQMFNKDSYPTKASFKHSDADAVVKLLTYISVSLSATFLVHFAYAFLGLSLPLDDEVLSRRW